MAVPQVRARHSEADRGRGAGAPVDLVEIVLGAGEADLESFGFAEPAFAFGFGDAGGEVVAYLGDALPLGGVCAGFCGPDGGQRLERRACSMCWLAIWSQPGMPWA
jgi:hypothetical protein